MDESQIDLAATFARIAQALASQDDLEETLEAIVGAALRLIEPCEHAGIDIVDGRHIRPVAPSSNIAQRVDQIQIEEDEGPCLDALRNQETYRTGDLSSEARWPDFASRAFDETGMRSILGLRLTLEEGALGALNLYSSRADAFDDDMTSIGMVLAAHASVALAKARTEEQLEKALETRDLIGQAKGMLMATRDVDAGEAFDVLKKVSQRHNVKLVEVAGLVVERDPLISDMLL